MTISLDSRIFAVAAAAATAVFAATAATQSSSTANLARNGNFENGLEGWKGVPPHYSIDPKGGRSGSAAFMYTNHTPEVSGFARLPLDLKPGRFYRYEIWVKTALHKRTTSGASVCIEWNDDKGKHLGGAYARGISGSNDWTRIDGITPRIPANATGIRISPLVPRNFFGSVWFDDISVTEHKIPPAGELSVSAYRNTFSSGEIRFCTALELSEVDFPSLDALVPEFSWQDASGIKRTIRATVFTRDRAECRITAAMFPFGESEVTFELRRKDGSSAGTSAAKVVRVKELPARRISFDRFNRTLVNGKPFFPLGMYWANPITEEDMATYAKGPFNSLMPYHPHTDKSMEICAKHGMMTCSVVRRGTKRYPPEKVAAYIDRFKNHPSLLAWYINDEAPLTKLGELTAFRRLLMEKDPEHPTWAVEDKCSLIRAFMPSFDVIGTDPYPIPMRPLSMAADWTRETRTGSYGMRPIWQVPQTFDWAAYRKMPEDKARAPTASEISTMTWLCIAEGANGIFFYSFHDLKKGTRGATFDERWKVVCEAGREVKEMIPLLLADPAEAPEVPTGISARCWSYGGKRHALLVNGTKETMEFTVPGRAEPVKLDAGEHVFLMLSGE